MRNVERMRPAENKASISADKAQDAGKTVDSDKTQDADALTAEVEELRRQLAEKDMQLAEVEQKVIRQRALYEKAHARERELERAVADREVEHTELIALREFV